MKLVVFIRRVWKLVHFKYRPGFIRFTIGLSLVGFFELFGLGLIIPFMSSLLKPDADSALFQFADKLSLEDPLLIQSVMGGGIVLLFVVKNLYYRWITQRLSHFVFGVYEELSHLSFRSFMSLSFLDLRGLNSNLVIRDIDTVPKLFAQNLILGLLQIIAEVVVLISILTILLVYDARIVGLVLMIILPPFVLYYRKVKNRIDYLAKKRHQVTGELRNTLQERIVGASEVDIYGKERFFSDRFGHQVSKLKGVQADFFYYKLVPPKIIETAMVSGIIVLFLAVSLLYDNIDDITLTLSLFGLAAFRTLPSFNRILAGLMSIRSGEFTLDVLDELVAKSSEHTQAESTLSDPIQNILFDDVSFTYSGKEEMVLSGINLSVSSGELIAIVGPSGSGKTTFLNVLLGLIKPTSGQVKLNNRSIYESEERIRGVFGYVKQEPFLIEGTMAQNLSLSEHPPSEQDKVHMLECLKLSGLQPLMDEHPDPLSMQIIEAGKNLSGGQRQRVSIARALYSRAPVIVYDEATSAVDPEVESKINETIVSLRKVGVTQLVVSHKTSILGSCDRVYELRKGLMSEKQFD